MLPNFLVIGAMKAGTSSLYRYLRDHPQVFMPEPKELNFFVAERNWRLGRRWYEERFEGAESALAVGEASPSYSMHPTFRDVPKRIADVIPDVRLIYVLRHPIDRMLSHYLATHHLRPIAGRERDPIQRERRPIGRALLNDSQYLGASLYSMQIERYLEFFAPEQLLVVVSEQLKRERVSTLARIFDFLRVDSSSVPPLVDEEFNRTAGKRVRRRLGGRVEKLAPVRALAPMLPASVKRTAKRVLVTKEIDMSEARITERLRDRLTDLVRDDVARLRSYVDDGFDGWGIA